MKIGEKSFESFSETFKSIVNIATKFFKRLEAFSDLNSYESLANYLGMLQSF